MKPICALAHVCVLEPQCLVEGHYNDNDNLGGAVKTKAQVGEFANWTTIGQWHHN